MREARAVRRRQDAAIAAVGALDMSWGVWADSVRQDVEARHDVAHPVPIEAADAVVLHDPEYGAALDCGTALDQVKQALQNASPASVRPSSFNNFRSSRTTVIYIT
jgi:hypothetical protein